MSAYNTLVTILKRSDGRDQLCGIGSASCELASYSFANPSPLPISFPALFGWSAEQASAVEAAFTKASKSFGSNRRWLRFALSIYAIPALHRRLSKFNPRTATVDQWRSQIAQVSGFLSAIGDDISVLGDLSVIPKPIGRFAGVWSCRFWFFGAILGSTKTLSELVNTIIKIQRLRARLAAGGSGTASSATSSSLPSPTSIVNGRVVTASESLRVLHDDLCSQSVDVVTNTCDLIWSSSCSSIDALQYPPSLVAAAALLTQLVGFKRYWQSIQADAIAAAAAAAAAATAANTTSANR